ncbi:MAG TPA: Hsp70 family protein [Rectinemataceae bacterium]|nr:Hsp70 family protein [Rectinemataceae bacterium]
MYGIDFGTSNTVVTMRSGGVTRILDLGEGGVVPTLLHFEKESAPSIGAAAMADYAAALSRYKGGTNLYSRFRFFQGLKLALKDPYFTGTRIFGDLLKPEELVGIFLRELRRRADAETGIDSRELVLGRPVVLSPDPDTDRELEGRFRAAAILAGFESVAFVPEPVAAAVSLLGSLEGLVLVFDFGGGTLDITIARLGGSGGGKPGPSIEVLGSEGMDLGGFVLNEDISRERITRHFGASGSWKSMSGRWLPMPSWITNQVSSFYALPLGDIAKTRSMIKELLPDARPADRPGLRGLSEFLDRNLGFSLFGEIDAAKIALSSADSARLAFAVPPHLSFTETISRFEFESLAASRVEAARLLVGRALAKAGVAPKEVTRVVRVGGSCKIPAFIRMLESEFPGRVVEGEVFTSIAAGLLEAAERGLAVG